MTTVHVRRHPDAASFLARAEAWLLRREAEHNLLIGLAHRLLGASEEFEPPIYLATVEREGEVVGCAFRTPPFKPGLTAMPEAALPLVVDDLADVYDTIPAVLGPEREAAAFARLWSQRRGVVAREGMRQRIYELDAVLMPERMPPGGIRLAEAPDSELVADWFSAFHQEAGVEPVHPRQSAVARIADRRIFLWDDGGPRCMVGIAGLTPNGARVGPVYTPREWRGRGYGTACTVEASRWMLESGRRFCFLYTDLANPTSNSIYRRIGYRPVLDVVDFTFGPPVR